MRRLIVLVSLVLAGCSGFAYPDQLNLAQAVCAPHGGLKHLRVYASGVYPEATCGNGLVVTLSLDNK